VVIFDDRQPWPRGLPRGVEDCVRLSDLRDLAVLLHPREANPGHYDAVLELLRGAGVEPRLELRDVIFDVAQTPVHEGKAVAIVGESTLVGLPSELAWVPFCPSAALEVGLLARQLDRAPAVERLLDTFVVTPKRCT
jgi:hypothetical protein